MSWLVVDPTASPGVPVAWLLAGSASPLIWAVAGLALALGIRARRSAPVDQ